MTTAKNTDIKTEHIIFRKTPPALHPYLLLARLDRPVGTWLLLWPCWWSMTLAAGGVDGISLIPLGYVFCMTLFGLGALLMRSAGCVVNDLWDRHLDAAVARTRLRPLAAGTVSVKQALWFLAALLLPSLVILLQFNMTTVVLGIISLVPVALYPAMKRFTWWPQAVLGLTFNWGAVMGWTAMTNEINLAPLLLYAAGICWTIGYDTLYALQDKDDDTLIGIRSTARLFGDRVVMTVAGFYAAAALLLAVAIVVARGYAPPLLAPALAALVLHFGWQVGTLNRHDSADCLRKFRSNIVAGLIILVACL